jgi:hypothetical protein
MITTDDENRHTGKTSSDDRLDPSVNRSDRYGEYRAAEQIGTELRG